MVRARNNIRLHECSYLQLTLSYETLRSKWKCKAKDGLRPYEREKKIIAFYEDGKAMAEIHICTELHKQTD
jgi:hypothetical protein